MKSKLKKKPPRALLTNRLYVKDRDIDEEIHLPPFRYKYKERVFDEMFGESVIVESEHASYKHNEKRQMYGFHRGNLAKIRRVFKDFEIVDKRVAPKLGFKLKRKFKPRPEQKSVTSEWLRNGYGVIKAPVRWGKTFAVMYLAVKLQTRVLILSDKIHLCHQWLKHFRKMTNVDKLEKKLGIRLIGVFHRKESEFFPITISTFQTLWARQRKNKFLSKNKNYFGFVSADETHHVPAETYGMVTAAFNAKYRCGVTATDKRRDQKHHLLYDIVGPVTGIGKTEQLPCEVVKHQTNIFIDPKASWGWMTTLITRSNELNDMVAAQVVKDVSEGRYVLVHTERKAHCHDFKEMIQDLDPSVKVGIAHGGVPISERDRLIKDMNDKKIHVIIGAKVIQEGLTFERPDVIHIGYSPTTNPDTWEQITGRVRTPMEGKPKPIIHDWRLKGHGGVYASGKARDKLYSKKKFKVSEDMSLGFGDKDKGLPPVPRFCGNCLHFFECKADEIRPKDEPCSSKEYKWTPLRLSPKTKMSLAKANPDKLRGTFSKSFVDSLASQNYSFWSRKQLGILQRIYEEILDHPKMWEWPKFVLKAQTEEEEEGEDNNDKDSSADENTVSGRGFGGLTSPR